VKVLGVVFYHAKLQTAPITFLLQDLLY